MVKMDTMNVEVERPKITRGEHRDECNFKTAKGFYYTLLNFEDMIGEGLEPYDLAIHGQRRWIFRGHWESTRGLIPTAFRKESYEKILPEEKKATLKFTEKNHNLRASVIIEQMMIEFSLLRQFMMTANELGIECNYTSSLLDYTNGIQDECYGQDGKCIIDIDNLPDSILNYPDSSILPLMSLAQHHGIPTRLLDFSYNPLFAAFFAASSPFFKEYINGNEEVDKEGDLCIWAISERERVSPFLKKIYAPSNRSSNLFAQEGVLVLDAKANENFKNTGEWQDFKKLVSSRYLVKLTLPKSQYKELLNLLWKHDITPAKIRPNLDRATETLKYIQWLSLQ